MLGLGGWAIAAADWGVSKKYAFGHRQGSCAVLRGCDRVVPCGRKKASHSPDADARGNKKFGVIPELIPRYLALVGDLAGWAIGTSRGSDRKVPRPAVFVRARIENPSRSRSWASGASSRCLFKNFATLKAVRPYSSRCQIAQGRAVSQPSDSPG